MKAPHPIRTAKLSIVGPDQYYSWGQCGNLGCCTALLSFVLFYKNKNKKRIVIKRKSMALVVRSYHDESTASHPNCEVKHRWARSVLQLGTMWESRVLYGLFYFFLQIYFFKYKKKEKKSKIKKAAPTVGLEPTTTRLRVLRSTN